MHRLLQGVANMYTRTHPTYATIIPQFKKNIWHISSENDSFKSQGYDALHPLNNDYLDYSWMQEIINDSHNGSYHEDNEYEENFDMDDASAVLTDQKRTNKTTKQLAVDRERVGFLQNDIDFERLMTMALSVESIPINKFDCFI